MIISKDIKFDCAHMLSNYEGKCANLHGHTYHGTVTLEGDVNPETSMVLDYNTIKQVVDRFDHAIVFSDLKERGDAEKALGDIKAFASKVLRDGKLPFLIGGEHLVSLPAIEAVFEKYPDLCLVHFDAHTDLREDYLGARLSHATVIRRAWDILGDGRIHQFGIRSGERAEFCWAREHTHLHKFNFEGLEESIASLKGKPVYFTIDLDVLDPSVFPGTGTPEAGGVTFLELLQAALKVIRGCEIVGCDMVELSPPYDASGASTAVALKLLRETLLCLERHEIA